jgi:hypothetical protein
MSHYIIEQGEHRKKEDELGQNRFSTFERPTVSVGQKGNGPESPRVSEDIRNFVWAGAGLP